MNNTIKKTSWWIFGGMCILIGLYPMTYFIIDREFGLLSTKSQELLLDQMWNFAFYGHIIPGGLALLIGWTQFSSKLRKTKISLHRNIGKTYIFSVLISGVCGLYVAQFATGGMMNVIWFSLSGILWLTTTFFAYRAIKNRKIKAHQNYMIYSYALCFSAVTLRIWLILLSAANFSFNEAYLIVAWLSWIPNLIVAFFIVRRKNLNYSAIKQAKAK